MNSERVIFAGKRIYIGIDVHRAFFVASCVCEGVVVKRCRMPSKSEAVEELLSKLDGDLQFSISCLHAEWEHLASQVKEIDLQLAQGAKADPLDAVYRSVPGIGPLIAQVLSTELGDMSQFPNERALFSFTGLTPGEYSSGNKVYRGHISRQGSSRLRHMLVEAAWKAIRKDEVLREFFGRIAKKAGKKRAIVAVARKLVGRIRAALGASTCYEVGHKKAA